MRKELNKALVQVRQKNERAMMIAGKDYWAYFREFSFFHGSPKQTVVGNC